MLAGVTPLDEILLAHASALGRDFTGYRNHTYRVLNFAAAFARPEREALEKLAIAAAFHDLGIWTAGTFDYLSPSEELARDYLIRIGKAEWEPEVRAMIREHHKITPYRGAAGGLVETFRKADWVDVSRGLLRFGLPRSLLREVLATFPNAGFHKKLVQLSSRRLLSHPWSPLPMFRL